MTFMIMMLTKSRLKVLARILCDMVYVHVESKAVHVYKYHVKNAQKGRDCEVPRIIDLSST
jgi:hypothetical protein